MNGPSWKISPVPPARSGEALRRVFAHLPEPQLGQTVANSLAEIDRRGDQPSGLLEAIDQDGPLGAVWAQIMPGAVSVLWPPGLRPGGDERAAAKLIDAATELARQAGAAMVQAMVSPDAHDASRGLLTAGYTHLADLDYLVCFSDRFPERPPESEISFEPLAEQNLERFRLAVQATYEATLDCPAMSGLRSMEDVLAGYRATGDPERAQWSIVRHAGRDVGCLLLADHTPEDFWELVYMGLSSSVRGRGFGRCVVRQAQWLCRAARRDRLVLAVDRRNAPARQIYMSCGFWRWDERRVFMRSFSPGQQAP